MSEVKSARSSVIRNAVLILWITGSALLFLVYFTRISASAHRLAELLPHRTTETWQHMVDRAHAQREGKPTESLVPDPPVSGSVPLVSKPVLGTRSAAFTWPDRTSLDVSRLRAAEALIVALVLYQEIGEWSERDENRVGDVLAALERAWPGVGAFDSAKLLDAPEELLSLAEKLCLHLLTARALSALVMVSPFSSEAFEGYREDVPLNAALLLQHSFADGGSIAVSETVEQLYISGVDSTGQIWSRRVANRFADDKPVLAPLSNGLSVRKFAKVGKRVMLRLRQGGLTGSGSPLVVYVDREGRFLFYIFEGD